MAAAGVRVSRVVYNRAASNAVLGDRNAALARLANLAAAGLIYDFARDEDFSTIKTDSAFAAVEKRIATNRQPLTHAQPAFPLGTPDMLPEDIAWDAKSKRFLVSSVRKSLIRWGDETIFAKAQ